jgi:hypothetical protein
MQFFFMPRIARAREKVECPSRLLRGDRCAENGQKFEREKIMLDTVISK